MLLQFWMNSKGTPAYIYIYPFSFKISSHPDLPYNTGQFPVIIHYILVDYPF